MGGARLWRFVKELAIVLIGGALIVSALLRAFVFEPFVIPSGSMQQTLEVSDKVVAQKLTEFKRGDVIIFRDPGHWVSRTEHQPNTNPVSSALEFIGVLPNSSQDYLTKRVIGTPGDRVSCCDVQGRITVNGYPLTEDYLYTEPNGQRVKPSDQPFDVIVPAGKLFVMGDHRNASADSRCHLTQPVPGGNTGDNAFVPIQNVVGPVGLIVAPPLDRFQQLKTPTTFDGVPPPAQPAPAEPYIDTRISC